LSSFLIRLGNVLHGIVALLPHSIFVVQSDVPGSVLVFCSVCLWLALWQCRALKQ